MNIKHLFPFFASTLLLLSAASCSEENEIGTVTPPDTSADDANRAAVQVSFKNTLKLTPVDGTKAEGDPIANDEENYIHSLDVYVFGAKEENGPYTFQELHYYRDDASEVNLPKVNAYSFNLTASDQGNVTTALLKLNKGLFVKLYCIANRKTLYITRPNGTIDEYKEFESLVQTAPGQPDNLVTIGQPNEDEFKKLHTKLIDPTATDPTEDDVLVSPLPMSGAYTTPLDLTDFGSSARTQISFKLTRLVARFDIVNNAEESKFTVEKISMGNGQSAAKFFPIETLVTDPAKLISYPERTVGIETQQKQDKDKGVTNITKGAFYTYPSPQADQGYLMLKGKYAVNKTESKDVSYQIPFQQMVNGVGTYIEISQNHRYTIAITKADTYHLDFTLKVADWDDVESGVDPYEPENDFDKNAPIVLEPTESTGAYVLDNGQISLLPADDSKLAFKMGSNADLTDEIVFKTGSAKWIKATPAVVPAPAPITKATSKEKTFAYEVDKEQLEGKGKLLPVTIRLTNPASGMRKEIVIIATPGPAVTLVKEEGNLSTFDPATMTATLYNVANQAIKFHVAAETRTVSDAEVTGSTATAAHNWITTSSNIDVAEGDYTLTLATVQDPLPASTTVDFTSVASTAKTTVKVVLKSPDMTALKADDFNVGILDGNQVEMTAGTGGIPKVTLVGIANNSFTLTVSSPEGVDVLVSGGDTWLEATTSEGSGKVNELKTTVITGKITDATGMGTTAKNDGKITITNKLDNTKTFEVEVVTALPAGPTVTFSEVAGNLSTYDESTKTASLYNAADQTITLTTDTECTITTTDGWLTVPGVKATEHVITVNAAQDLTITSTGKVTFTNDNGGVTEVTIQLLDPAINPLEAGDFNSTEGDNTFEAAADPANAKVTMKEATATSAFTLTVKSKGGISVDPSTSSWLTVTKTDETENAGVYTATLTVTITDGTDLDAAITGGKIVLKNGIEGADDLTIDVETTIPAVIP